MAIPPPLERTLRDARATHYVADAILELAGKNYTR